MMVALDRLKNLTNFSKIPKSYMPNYRIFGEKLSEVDANWVQAIQILGKKLSAIFGYFNICGRRDYVILICVKDPKEKKITMVWTTRQKAIPYITYPPGIHIRRVFLCQFAAF